MDIREYEQVFNVGDDAALIERFYCKDLKFAIDGEVGFGSDGLLQFFTFAHDGVREIMRVQSAVTDADIMFAEIDMDFHATKRREDFPLAVLDAGDSITVKMIAKYVLCDGKIAELTVMRWPVGVGVTRLPRLGASHPTQRAAFYSLCAALVAGDVERVVAFCTPQVMVSGVAELEAVGVDAVTSALKELLALCTVEVMPSSVSLGEDRVELSWLVAAAPTSDRSSDGSGCVVDGVLLLADGLIDAVMIVAVRDGDAPSGGTVRAVT